MPIPNEEYFDMLAVYFECMQNATIAARLYAVRYPDRRRNNSRFFLRLAARLRTTGNVHRPIYRRIRRGRTEENVINTLAYIQFDPHVSIRRISIDLGIAHGTVQNILHEHR